MNTKTQHVWNGLLAALIGLPFAALFYLGESIANLPFLPADFMNWIIPFVPGDLITFGINTMVDIIIALGLGREDVVAKLFESLMASAIFVGILGIGGTFVGRVLSLKLSAKLPNLSIGLVIGVLIAIPLAIISNDQLTGDNPFYDGPSLSIRTLWILGVIALWGMITQIILQTANQTAEATSRNEDTQKQSTEIENISEARSQKVTAINRRKFLVQVGGTSAVLTIIGAGLGELLRENETIVAADQVDFSFLNFPNANARVIPAPGTRPEYTPIDNHYRIDINSANPPSIDGEAWRLTLKGLIENPTTYSLQQLQEDFTPLNQYVTISCISNRIGGSLIGTTGWTGVSMQDILREVRPLPEATHIKITSADGFWEYVDLDLVREDQRIMLCYAWNEELLRVKHGFPLRIYIPDRYGMKQPKWITELEFVDSWGRGYWVERGWSAEAIVQTTSVIDTVAVEAAYEQNGQTLIPIGGIAYAGARGISKVEVRIDEGEWQTAELRQPLSPLTWVIWRYDWPMQSGEHTFEVRCYDGEGTLQIEETRPNKPNGATGIHSFSTTI